MAADTAELVPVNKAGGSVKMDFSDTFEFEEREGRKYLVYEKREGDILDTFTMEMLSNNKIEGLAAFSCVRMNHEVRMKYNITGLTSLKEMFADTINRKNFLSILESLADAVIRADDYMLDVSEYVFDETFIYVNPADMRVSMIVLPICQEGMQANHFLKQMLFDVRYDQAEDCSYVASLMNFLRDSNNFSMRSFKEEVLQYKKANLDSGNRIVNSVAHDNKKMQDVNPEVQVGKIMESESPAKEHASHTREKEKNLHILFSESPEEEPKKKKKSFFVKKEKEGRKEKKGIFGRKSVKKQEIESETGPSVKSPLDGIAIPGMDFMGKLQEERGNGKDLNGEIPVQRQEIPIPAQRVKVVQREVDQQDFGETVYMDEEAETPTIFEENPSGPIQKFVLYRCSTQETYEIRGDVVRVGRSPSISEICISGNRGVGRVHAVLYVRGGQVYIADNNSKNKTYVDGVELKPGDPPAMLLSGSRIKLGTEELEFRISR